MALLVRWWITRARRRAATQALTDARTERWPILRGNHHHGDESHDEPLAAVQSEHRHRVGQVPFASKPSPLLRALEWLSRSKIAVEAPG